MGSGVRWGVALFGAGAIAAAARRTRALTRDGALAATAVGTITFARGGLPGAAALLAFFVSGSALSRFKQAEKGRRGGLAQAKGGERDAWQVLANGGAATLCLLLWGQRGAPACLGALAAAAGDTWATELGLLARARPRLVTTLAPVAPGTSGGVSEAGTLASALGALTVGIAWRMAGGYGAHALRGAVAAGVGGALIDSVLGATVQAGYRCATCDEPAETPVHTRCGQATTLVRGVRWIDNDAVNALATTAGAALGALFIGHAGITRSRRRRIASRRTGSPRQRGRRGASARGRRQS